VLIVLGVALAGGLGAAARLVLDGAVRQRIRDYPLGTLLVNLTGCLLLGLVTGLTAAAVLPPSAQRIVGTGFLGGYTTFSTAAVETVRLVRERRVAAALLHGLGMLVGGVALAALGWALGTVAAH
jgi:CrcB protein